MTAATVDHSHHCSCAKLPTDLWQRITSAYSANGEAWCRELLRVITGSRNPASPAVSPHRPRFLGKVTPPDPSGHQHYLGMWPRWGAPRVMYAGRTLDITQWLYVWNQFDGFDAIVPDQHLTRTCTDVQCVSPDHHRLPAPAPVRVQDDLARSRVVFEWEALHPKPFNPRSTAWLRGVDYLGERCQANHLIKVYPGPRRKSYCAQCAAIMRAWEAERKDVLKIAETQMTGLPPRVPNLPTLRVPEPAPSPGPTLADEVERMFASGAWDTPVS